MLRADHLPEIVCVALSLHHLGRPIDFGGRNVGMDVEQAAHHSHDLLIEIQQKSPPPLEKRSQVVRIELKEGGVAIGTAQGIPMKVPPVAVVADPHVADVGRTIVDDRYGERLHPLRRSDEASVAVGLFHEMVMALQPHLTIPVQFLIPLHRTEIGG